MEAMEADCLGAGHPHQALAFRPDMLLVSMVMASPIHDRTGPSAGQAVVTDHGLSLILPFRDDQDSPGLLAKTEPPRSEVSPLLVGVQSVSSPRDGAKQQGWSTIAGWEKY